MEKNIKIFSEDYLKLTGLIKQEGNLVSPRGKNTKEIRPVTLIFEKPLQKIITVKNRNINPFFLAVEAIWILTGREDVDTLSFYNENISQFSDDGFYFHGAYGNRIRRYGASVEMKTKILSTIYEKDIDTGLNLIKDIHKEEKEIVLDQLKEIFFLLKKDIDTRKAVVSIWNPIMDLNVETKDTPCNDLLMFDIRNNLLNLFVLNRSNDLHWGLPTNLFQFSTILEIMSFVTGNEIGTQTHFTKSLHYYLDNEITDNILKENKFLDLYKYFSPYKFNLAEDYAIYLKDKRDLYDKTFDCLEQGMQAIESFFSCFGNFIVKVEKENITKEEANKIFDVCFFNDYSFKIVKAQSQWMYSIINFSLIYFLYKQIFLLLKNEEKLKKNLNICYILVDIIEMCFLNVLHNDLKFSGIIFLEHLLFNRIVKRKNSNFDLKMHETQYYNFILFFQKKLKEIINKLFIDSKLSSDEILEIENFIY